MVRVHLALVLVHEGVGFGEDGVDAAEGRDLDGATDGDADVLAGVGGAQLFEHGVGFLFGDVLDDEQEFVASHAEDALGACGGDEYGRGFLDEQVAGLMAFRVFSTLSPLMSPKKKASEVPSGIVRMKESRARRLPTPVS